MAILRHGSREPAVEAWNSVREVTYPWTFDAVHYPFLKTGWGFGIPSLLALLGLLVIISQLITPRFGQQAALWSILTLLSMPTLMLQATTTKNDLVLVGHFADRSEV